MAQKKPKARETDMLTYTRQVTKRSNKFGVCEFDLIKAPSDRCLDLSQMDALRSYWLWMGTCKNRTRSSSRSSRKKRVSFGCLAYYRVEGRPYNTLKRRFSKKGKWFFVVFFLFWRFSFCLLDINKNSLSITSSLHLPIAPKFPKRSQKPEPPCDPQRKTGKRRRRFQS